MSLKRQKIGRRRGGGRVKGEDFRVLKCSKCNQPLRGHICPFKKNNDVWMKKRLMSTFSNKNSHVLSIYVTTMYITLSLSHSCEKNRKHLSS